MQEGQVLGQPCQFLAVDLLLPYQSHMSGCLAKCCKAAVGTFFCAESGFTQLHQPKEHPQSITGENIVKWVFSCYGETPSSV